MLAQVAGTSPIVYLLADGHGSTQQLASANGTLTAAYQFSTFGGAINFSPAFAGTVFMFGGDAVYDPVSSLYLHGNGVRPANGFLFIQADRSAGNTQDPLTFHKYLYADADPINFDDPTGMSSYGSLLTALGLGAGFAAQAVTSGEGVLDQVEGLQNEIGVEQQAVAGLADSIESGISDAVQNLELQQISFLGQQQSVLQGAIDAWGAAGRGIALDAQGEYGEELARSLLPQVLPAGVSLSPGNYQVANDGVGSLIDFFAEGDGESAYIESKLSLPTIASGDQWTRLVNQLTNAFEHGGSGANVILNVTIPPTSDEIAQFLGDLDEAVPGIANKVQVTTSLLELAKATQNIFGT